MAVGSKYLKPMLSAGSSRVFNCNEIHRRLVSGQVEDCLFFKNRHMHSLVIIKEFLNKERDEPHPQRLAIGTKLYFPYNEEDVYEGGRSIFLHSAKLNDVLREQFGLGGPAEDAEVQRDLNLLHSFDQLPSLDGFLMRDRLEIEGIVANERYFEVSENERYQIKEFIRKKIAPLVRAAYGNEKSAAGKTSQLIDKIWEAKDMVALDRLIQAFHLPASDAPAIFASWKGINYYSYEYLRTKAKREAFARWLKDDAVPREGVARDVRLQLDELRRDVVARLRSHWKEVLAILTVYDTSYAKLVNNADVAPFIRFLAGVKEVYWCLGDSLSKIDHAAHCWSLLSKPFSGRRMSLDALETTFEMARAILSDKAAVRGDLAAA